MFCVPALSGRMFDVLVVPSHLARRMNVNPQRSDLGSGCTVHFVSSHCIYSHCLLTYCMTVTLPAKLAAAPSDSFCSFWLFFGPLQPTVTVSLTVFFIASLLLNHTDDQARKLTRFIFFSFFLSLVARTETDRRVMQVINAFCVFLFIIASHAERGRNVYGGDVGLHGP